MSWWPNRRSIALRLAKLASWAAGLRVSVALEKVGYLGLPHASPCLKACRTWDIKIHALSGRFATNYHKQVRV